MSWFGKSDVTDSSRQKTAADSDTPWLNAARRHEFTYLRLDQQVKNWRLFAFMGLALSAIAIGGAIYIGAKSKFVPYLVEVDRLGRTVAVRALNDSDTTADPHKLIYREMFELVENLRTVTTDRLANDDRIEKGLGNLTGAALTYAKSELRKAKPNEIGAIKSIQVKVKSALKLGGKSWQVEWEEHSFNLNGDATGVETWRATVQYEIVQSSEESVFRRNPLGFTVSELSWQKVN